MDLKDRRGRFSLGLWLLAPAPFVFALRSVLELAGVHPNGVPAVLPATILAGVLSGLGMLILLWATYRTPDFVKILVAFAVAFSGHYVVDRLVDADLGAAMVYLGTGFAGSLRIRWAAYAGIAAGAGALLRGSEAADVGLGLLAVAATALGVLLVLGARRSA